jgi:hypothetical protein
MISKLSLGGILVMALGMTSCSSSDLGTGMNTVNREYTASVKQAHDAALAALKEEDLILESDKTDSLGANIVAKRRTSDEKVHVDVKGLDKGQSQVSVRVDPGDKPQATMIQDRIGEKLAPAAK